MRLNGWTPANDGRWSWGTGDIAGISPTADTLQVESNFTGQAEVLRSNPDRFGAGKQSGESMTDQTVDVAIPTYGQPRYLRDAVESVMAQTISSWRLTIFENGAGTAAVQDALHTYLDDPRVTFIRTGEECQRCSECNQCDPGGRRSISRRPSR